MSDVKSFGLKISIYIKIFGLKNLAKNWTA